MWAKIVKEVFANLVYRIVEGKRIPYVLMFVPGDEV